jgi:hypothetical protein
MAVERKWPNRDQNDAIEFGELAPSKFRNFRISLDGRVETALLIRHPVPTEGRFAIVTNVGRDAVDALALLTNSAQADGEVVWS